MRILLTLCARGGSKGVKNKNLVPIGGKPLIGFSIDQAKAWGRADRIVCSTDSEDIARVAREHGADVPFVRPAALSGDEVGKIPVLRHVLAECGGPDRYDVLVDLDVTSPVRTVGDLESGWKRFLERKPEVLFSVTRARKNPYFNMVERRADGSLGIVKALPGAVLRRQDAPDVFDLNASIYYYDSRALAESRYPGVLQSRFDVFEMPEESAFDIDSELDVVIVTAILRHKGWI